jgi:hypothetical protein
MGSATPHTPTRDAIPSPSASPGQIRTRPDMAYAVPATPVKASLLYNGLPWIQCSLSITAAQQPSIAGCAVPVNSTVLVRGDGVAAACCVRSLSAHGLQVSVVRTGRAKLSAVLLGEATQSLLTDLFADKKLLAGLPQIRKRVVAWGPGAQPVALPHSALVISEHDLLERLWARVQTPIEVSQSAGNQETNAWEIISSRTEQDARNEGRFGSRHAFVSNVQLKAAADRESCWAESLDAGWLFLFPLSGASACLISVGGPANSLLTESRLIAAQVEKPLTSTAEFPAYPRILSELCGSGWLACGTAAMTFDPLCGEGVANAVREAILASAVIRAALQGSEVDSLLAHYRARLMNGFLRHLHICHHYYSTGGTGPFWSSELKLLQRGIESLSARLQPQPSPQYRLLGFELVALP